MPDHQPKSTDVVGDTPQMHFDQLRIAEMAVRWPVVEVVSQTGSTNADLLARAQHGSVHGVARFAALQTAGRGRRGRPWLSSPGGNIYVSLAWEFDVSANALAGLSLAVGVIIAEVLDTSLGVRVALKWPNDIYIGDAKVGGVLVELAGSGKDTATAVIGIGLNLQLAADVEASIGQSASDVGRHAAGAVDRDALAAALLNGLAELLSDYGVSGFSAWRALWQKRDWLWQRPVSISGGEVEEGVAVGVDELGYLQLETASGIVRVIAGEASVRPRSGS